MQNNREIQRNPDISGLKDKQLYEFYSNETHMREFISCVVLKEQCIPLRAMDWLVTNYSKKNDINYNIVKLGVTKQFNIRDSYECVSKSFLKKTFDVFARCESVQYKVTYYDSHINKTYIFDTTEGQLKFYRWALENLVVEYLKKHKDEIISDMNIHLKPDNHTKIKGKKTELSKSILRTPIINNRTVNDQCVF